MRPPAAHRSAPRDGEPESQLLGSHWLGVDEVHTESAGGARVDGERVQALDPLGQALDELGLVCGPPEHAQAWAVRVSGSAGAYARLWWGHALVVLLTLGLALPWARCRSLRHVYGHTRVAGHPLGYHGEPGAMLGGALLCGVLLATGAAAVVWGPPGWPGVAAAAVALGILAATVPALVQSALQGRLARTSWRDMPLRFFGTPAGAARVLATPLLGAWACAVAALALPVAEAHDPEIVPALWTGLGLLLAVGLLGAPCLVWMFLGWRQANLGIGPLQAQWKVSLQSAYALALRALAAFTPAALLAAGAALLALVACGWLAAPPALARAGAAQAGVAAGVLAVLAWLAAAGLAWPWLQASLQNLVWGKTGNRYVRIRSRLDAGAYVRLRLRHAVCVLATLGVYLPWARAESRRMRLQSISIVSRVVPDDLAATVRQMGDTRPAGELFGLDLGW